MSTHLYTVGHSNHTESQWLALLREHSITAVFDIRSHPHSRHNPHFNRETLRSSLERNGIHYAFLGDELGARSDNLQHAVSGKIQYETVAASEEFRRGLEHIREDAAKRTLALMCAEKDPIRCHRAILVCRNLRADPIIIKHIHEDGTLESTSELEARLLRTLGLPKQDLFTDRREMVERAYDLQSDRIAYSIKGLRNAR